MNQFFIHHHRKLFQTFLTLISLKWRKKKIILPICKLLRTQLWYGNDIKKESVIIMIVWKMSLYFCMHLVIWRCFNACKIDAHSKPSLCPFSPKRLKCISSFFKSANYCIRWYIGRRPSPTISSGFWYFKSSMKMFILQLNLCSTTVTKCKTES